MKLLKHQIIIAGACLVAAIAAGVTWRHQAEQAHWPTAVRPAEKGAASPAMSTADVGLEKPSADQPPVEATPSPQTAKVALPAASPAAKSPLAQSKPKSAPKPKEPIQDPMAREALSYVGADPLADQYWIVAINDLALPADERRELIEDLNQDGFADLKHLTQDDTSLIINRLQLIENLAPDSMDQVNYDAFQEAYKDLVNMLAKAP